MNHKNHLSESELMELLTKRMDEYFVAITGNSGSWDTARAIKTAQHLNLMKVRSQLIKSKLFESDLWGYGINSISDGHENHSCLDVDEFKLVQGLNKHHHEQRFLWLLTFKIDSGAFFVSIFCIDTATHGVNSNLNSKFELKDFKNVRIRTRQQKIYIDVFFENTDKPIQFQIDSYGKGAKMYGEQLAEFYLKNIETEASKIKLKNNAIQKVKKDKKIIEQEVDTIEEMLRITFVQILEQNIGENQYQLLLAGKHKADIKRRIKQHVEKHPKVKIDDYNLLKKAIEFSDIDHLKQSILKDANWSYFEPKFRTKESVEKYFSQLGDLRHVLKHSRELSELIELEGKAAIEWFKQILEE